MQRTSGQVSAKELQNSNEHWMTLARKVLKTPQEKSQMFQTLNDLIDCYSVQNLYQNKKESLLELIQIHKEFKESEEVKEDD